MNKNLIAVLILTVIASGCASFNGDMKPASKYVFTVDTEDSDLLNKTAEEISKRFSATGMSSHRPEISEKENKVNLYVPAEFIPAYTDGSGGFVRTNKSLIEENGILEEPVEVSIETYMPVMLSDGDSLGVGENYSVEVERSTIQISGNNYKEGDSFNLDGANFTVEKLGSQTILKAKIYDEENVESASIGRLTSRGNKFTGRIHVTLDKESAERMFRIAQNYEIVNSEYGNRYLAMKNGSPVKIETFRNKEKLNEMLVGSDFKDRKTLTHFISLSGDSREEISNEAEEIVKGLTYSELPADVRLTEFEEVRRSEEYFEPKIGN